MPELELINPDWAAPANVVALQTTRHGGFSREGYASLNLASHVDDDDHLVGRNRKLLAQTCGLPGEPAWLQQTHSTRVINLDRDHHRQGDAARTARPGAVAVVLTADCLPVLFCHRDGHEVAAAHAGWRGLVGGILEQTVASMQSPAHELLAWLGPAIGPTNFEVGVEVLQAFVELQAESAAAFTENRPGHYLADLYQLARLRLKRAGVDAISGGDQCTFADTDRFISYRREKTCGRQASLIYIKP